MANKMPSASVQSSLFSSRSGNRQLAKRQGQLSGVQDSGGGTVINQKGTVRSIAQFSQDAAASKNAHIRAAAANAVSARFGNHAGVHPDGSGTPNRNRRNSSGVVGGANDAQGANSRAWSRGSSIAYRDSQGTVRTLPHADAMKRMSSGGVITRNQANAAARIAAGKLTG